jgi:uncharacterized protein with PIN domain
MQPLETRMPQSAAQSCGHMSMSAFAQLEAVLVIEGRAGDVLASCTRSVVYTASAAVCPAPACTNK